MPEVDLVDATWIAAAPAAVAAEVSDASNWPRWWPGMTLRIDRDRGLLGMQWLVTSCTDFTRQPMDGSMEVWLEAAYDGVVLHYFLRLAPSSPPATSPPLGRSGLMPSRRRSSARRAQRAHALRAKQNFWAVKDRLEAAAGSVAP